MIRIPGRWWSKLKNWMLKRMLRGSRMVSLRPNPAKQAPVSQHRKCKTRTDMATRVSALEAEIEEDKIWSKDYASAVSGLAVSLRSEQGGSVSLFWFSGLMLAQPMSSTGLEWARTWVDSKDRQGKPRLADCRLWMRGFGDDCDSLAGLVVLSHKPTLERLLERERMTESRERNKEIVCGLA
ncbi:hypothetical protein NEUTE1DRAFT_122030 [Neurospora tetrasperma FGSC 2508]|uniref:Uncharacterized protein n=1 Tax=Neurospora tetrasperma (strain FGSC 2508 / ATCC MYA-4615 / P0657) TaxID=510951 RepID=F8MLS5_NEUT8|nr:uncharacterized protein NEUTE1DRAFT_122030 [Neurospora tetrasperma FGSC 2508]EGO57644.1 hypothetical protein NEUTE1DRAFT_122030 [Neurospora tetrasperma FGSC 2508]